MDALSSLADGFAIALTWQNLGLALLGCFLGTLIGALPGLGPSNGVAILIPLVFNIGLKAFPWVIAVVLAITGLFMIVKPDDDPEWPTRQKFLRIIWSVVAMVLYAELLPIVGFVVTTAAVAAFLAWQLGATLLQAAVGGVVISGGIYVVFHLVLGLSLARGPLGF